MFLVLSFSYFLGDKSECSSLFRTKNAGICSCQPAGSVETLQDLPKPSNTKHVRDHLGKMLKNHRLLQFHRTPGSLNSLFSNFFREFWRVKIFLGNQTEDFTERSAYLKLSRAEFIFASVQRSFGG